MNPETREMLVELGKMKIGWKICKVNEYIGTLRCYKCCGFYHFAKNCTRKEPCGNCAGQHVTKKCNNQIKKCVNCEEKIKHFKIVNLDLNYSAYDNKCSCFKKELEKRMNRVRDSC